MSNTHSRRRGMNYGVGKEMPYIILGIVFLGILVAISWVIGSLGIYEFGGGAISYGLLGSGAVGYLYAALNRKRKYSDTLFAMAGGYIVWAFFIPIVIPEASATLNIIQASVYGFFVEILYGAVIFVLNVAALVYAKRTDLR